MTFHLMKIKRLGGWKYMFKSNMLDEKLICIFQKISNRNCASLSKYSY